MFIQLNENDICLNSLSKESLQCRLQIIYFNWISCSFLHKELDVTQNSTEGSGKHLDSSNTEFMTKF